VSENAPISRLSAELLGEHAKLLEFFDRYDRAVVGRSVADFVAGNPQEMPLPRFVNALRTWLEPRSKDHFAYKMSDPAAVKTVVASVQDRVRMRVEPDDIAMTNGAFSGLTITLRAICDPGDEVIYLSPPWFFYRGIIRSLGATPVRVAVDMNTWDIDVAAIERAVTPRTRAILVNSPNNPTGRLYPRATLDTLAGLLQERSRRSGRRIYLISDEAYSRILFDGHSYESPALSYPHTLIVYTYGKQLLTPGERIGYVALTPTMPAGDRAALRGALMVAQLVTGWAWPNAVLQYALGDLENVSIDIPHLQRKRDRVVTALKDAGYRLHIPEGTFYLLPNVPWKDDDAFYSFLNERGVFVLPGSTIELPGTFRISLTANDEMIDRALPVFAAAVREPAPA
jgi:aspartate aminotransferase